MAFDNEPFPLITVTYWEQYKQQIKGREFMSTVKFEDSSTT